MELREEAISAYEESMRRRAGEEVRLCDSNTAQLHDWEQVKESPVMKSGLQSLHKVGLLRASPVAFVYHHADWLRDSDAKLLRQWCDDNQRPNLPVLQPLMRQTRA